jgi:molecular chaperone DnaJ
MATDYYELLGVAKNASKDELKKAYHKLAHKYHPDKNNGDDTKFKEVNHAYQTLSDDQKRAGYDRFGADGPQQQAHGGHSQSTGFGGFDFSGFQNGGVEFDMGDLGEMFGDMFGGARSKKARRGRDMSTSVAISFEESIFGVTKKIHIKKQSACDTCKGTGAKVGTNLDSCTNCKGSGQVREMKRSILGAFETRGTCSVCFGEGKIPKEKCTDCKGSAVRAQEKELSVTVPAGIKEGEMLRIAGEGEAVRGGTPGDLYVELSIGTHSVYTREGNTLIAEATVSITDALLGVEYPLTTLEGAKIEVTIPAGVEHGALLRIKGKGVPSSRGRGDIILKVSIEMPQKLSKRAKELISQLKEEGL